MLTGTRRVQGPGRQAHRSLGRELAEDRVPAEEGPQQALDGGAPVYFSEISLARSLLSLFSNFFLLFSRCNNAWTDCRLGRLSMRSLSERKRGEVRALSEAEKRQWQWEGGKDLSAASVFKAARSNETESPDIPRVMTMLLSEESSSHLGTTERG